MMLSIKNMAGTQVGEIELNDTVFAAPVNKALMHQALVRQLANARLGAHKTKTRSEVAGGGRKPWRQKGTGRARQGSTRSPQWVGGGSVFGPRPRKYTKQMPRKMRRSALRSALTVKVGADQIIIVDDFTVNALKTKEMVQALSALGADGKSVLLVPAEKNETLWRSARNLPQVKILLSGYLNMRDLLGYDLVIMSRDAVEHVNDWLGVAESEAVESDVVASEAVEAVESEAVEPEAVEPEAVEPEAVAPKAAPETETAEE
jgi:large subunit ribosomal protein L4